MLFRSARNSANEVPYQPSKEEAEHGSTAEGSAQGAGKAEGAAQSADAPCDEAPAQRAAESARRDHRRSDARRHGFAGNYRWRNRGESDCRASEIGRA